MIDGKTYFYHVRISSDDTYSCYPDTSARGGATIAVQKNGTDYRAAVAYCSENDNYCRATGRELAAQKLNEAPLELNFSLPCWIPGNPLQSILSEILIIYPQPSRNWWRKMCRGGKYLTSHGIDLFWFPPDYCF